MNILISITLVLAVFWKIRNNFYRRLELKYSYILYDLRDTLREMAISKKINAENWQFKYLDSSYSKTIKQLPNLNLFLMLLYSSKEENNKSYFERRINVLKGMKENEVYIKMYEEYITVLVQYMLERHYMIRFLQKTFFMLHIVSNRLSTKFKNSFKKLVSNITILPETSTIGYYCP